MSLFDQNELKSAIDKTINSFKQSLKTINTGRPRPEMLESLIVKAYDQDMELKMLTSIEVIDGKFKLQPWDSSTLQAIEIAVRNFGKGLSPVVKDNIIFVSLPVLTQETRLERVKEVNSSLEEYRVSIRRIRHDFMDEIELAESVSEDMKDAAKKQLQAKIDEANSTLETIAKEKEAELMEV